MKIELNHNEEDIQKLIAEAVITDKDVDYTDDEIKSIILMLSDTIQKFEIGVLVRYLSLKKGSDIQKASELIQFIVEDAGFENAKKLTSIFTEVINKNQQKIDEDLVEPEEITEEQ